MKLRNDLRAEGSPVDLEVVQLTTGDLPSSHLYMEAQVFTPDSARFLLHESSTAHGSDKDDPHHRYLVCDLVTDCVPHPITDETGATAPSVSPDGQYVYYFVNETETNGGRLTLKRVGIDGMDRQTLLVLDAPIPGIDRQPSRIYPLSTIRSDGGMIALSCFLGNGQEEGLLWGLMVFDLDSPSVEVILTGESWCNIHPQYCRSTDPEHICDILVQENHGNLAGPNGEVRKLTSPPGADIHVIRDDGTDFRNMPWGRDGNESCQGHQCWRGKTEWAITSTGTKQPAEKQLIESRAVPRADHAGSASPQGIRNHISASFAGPCFSHFATDAAGTLLVTDTVPDDQGGRVFLGGLGQPGEDPASSWTCLANPRSSWQKEAHIHPFLSPDGTRAFFNSDESGTLQAYMIRGLETL
ncbi:MAG: hypothetical protein QGI83_21010 [Candidatus Latescibacteria bacterium]|jgi:hypothetical protein|nr:hypothetical protein [Candidatus Latescibacterota bacterium]